MTYSTPPNPEVGSQVRRTAKTRISMRPSQKSAVETPVRDTRVTTRSAGDRGQIAETMPRITASGSAKASVTPARYKVAGMRSSTTGSAGTRCQMESPKSPRARLPM
jgi:hypothetical protein